MSKPGAAARTSKPAAAPGTRTSIAEPPVAELPIAEPPIAEPPVAGPPIAEPPVAGPPIAEPVPAVTGTSEDPTVATVELEPEPAVAAAVPEDPDPTTAGGPHAAVPVAELGPAATHEELPWREHAQTRREESAERRQQRQERARIRREAATGKRMGSAAAAGWRAAPMAPVHEEVPGGRRIQRGTVKWFSEAKGYGFVKAEGGADAFVHHSSISSAGLRTLSVGQAVSYDEVESAKGLVAVNVVPMAQGTDARRQ